MCIRDSEQAERLLDAIRDLPPYVFVMIGLYAGLRREEILALQWDSVYLDTCLLYTSCGTRKTGGFFSRFFKCHELVTFGAEFSGNFLWLVTLL